MTITRAKKELQIMTTPANLPQNESTYVIDAENAAEMARLTRQDRLITKTMGGLFPERSDLSGVHDILDVACGPGGWVLDVACTYPQVRVTGIDISVLMIEYARAKALTQGLKNTSFRVMDALKPLDFPDESFDLVNARSIFAFVPTPAWPGLLKECLRITRPGGVIRLTEPEWYITNSPATEKLNTIFLQALKTAGQSFSPDGRHAGITPMLGRLLHDAGCVNIQKKAHVLDCSAGAEMHTSTYENYLIGFKLIQPFLVRMGGATQEEIDVLYHRMLEEMQAGDFCGIMFFLTVWGLKPGQD